jgi:hypothetical protein
MRTRDKRIGRVKQAIEEAPVRRHLLREAYEWFKDFGDLPEDDDHVAFEVVQQALNGGKEQPLVDEAKVRARVRKAEIAHQRREALDDAAWPPSVRALLFNEALFEFPALRAAARAQIAVEVAYGGDVENPAFGARHGIPVYGSIALHMGGWHKRLVLPPYEFQAEQLLVRFDNIRGQIPHEDPKWFEVQGKAIVKFKETGELPDDDLHIDSVLANVEMDQLVAHKKGKDVSEVMALLNTVQRRDGEEQQEALKRVCEMAAAGRIF